MKAQSVRPGRAEAAVEPKPFVVAKGSVSVRGYWVKAGYWQLVWYGPTGVRERKTFTKKTEARRFASHTAGELASQTSGIRTLTAEESIDYDTAKRKLPAGVRLTDAVEFWLTRHPANAPRKRVGQVVVELLARLGGFGRQGRNRVDGSR